jgi:hypothetical protein
MEEQNKNEEERKDLKSFKEGGMFHGIPPQIFEAARQVMKEMTVAAQLLWQW